MFTSLFEAISKVWRIIHLIDRNEVSTASINFSSVTFYQIFLSIFGLNPKS